MNMAQVGCNFLAVDTIGWTADWAWGLPLIVLTVVVHVTGLGLISQKFVNSNLDHIMERRHPKAAFVMVVGATTLLATSLHALEAGIWAAAYRLLGALPDARVCMLYSLNAMTSYGHTSLNLADHWHLLGALEALNGWLLFGLTTAFLFAVIQKIWSLDTKPVRR
jgi:hypothetical protein